MKKVIVIICCILSAVAASAQVFPVAPLKWTGAPDRRINMVILPDGFTTGQLPAFHAGADSIRIHMFAEAPLQNYERFYNIYYIDVPSVDSGCDHPGTATDVVEPLIPYAVKNTYFDASFDAFAIHRLLVPNDEAAVYSVLATNFPSYDQVILLVNTPAYGGSGGAIATSSLNPDANEIVKHELGHSFAGLADEYWAGSVYAKEMPNMTAESDPALVKWNNWIGKDLVGVYPYGAYPWYKPHTGCKMQVLDSPFCHVCQQAFIDKIYDLVTPIDSTYPDAGSKLSVTDSALSFYIKLIKPIPNTLVVKWQMNGVDIAGTDTGITINKSDLPKPEDTLRAFITDTTGLSRSFRPAKGYQFTTAWYLHKGGVGIIDVTRSGENGKFFYSIYPVPAKNSVWIAYENRTTDTKAAYTLIDANGRVAVRNTLALQPGKQKAEINTSGIIPGIYLLSLKGNDINIAERIIIE